MPDEDCACGLDGEAYQCINGVVYGPCDDERCGGVCDPKHDCDHECHTKGSGLNA